MKSKTRTRAKLSKAKLNRAKPKDSKLKDSKIKDSKLKDSKLKDSRIKDSKLKDSRIKDSKISGPKISRPKIGGPQINGPKINEPKTNEPKINEPKIKGPKIRQPDSPGPLRLTLPATSANLGPAFDAAALAFDINFEITAKPAMEYSIQARGRDTAICGELKDNLIVQTYENVLRANGRAAAPLAFSIKNEIPIGKGCGSSAAARLAGIAFAVHFGQLPWGDAEIIAEASRLEHHPDNAAACWVGGVAVARMTGSQVQAVKITPKGKWPLLLAVPEEKLSTEAARSVLPETYSRADAVANIQSSMLLLTALTEGYPDLLAGALEDRIHQPYRAKLCPLLPALRSLTGQVGILGVALSGAGPSVLIFLDARVPATRTREGVAAFLKAEGLSAELLPTTIATKGAVRARG